MSQIIQIINGISQQYSTCVWYTLKHAGKHMQVRLRQAVWAMITKRWMWILRQSSSSAGSWFSWSWQPITSTRPTFQGTLFSSTNRSACANSRSWQVASPRWRWDASSCLLTRVPRLTGADLFAGLAVLSSLAASLLGSIKSLPH